ncbi:hypothetical protein RRG08_053039 [Elysia crispata]|uniref:Uncharacterized protein n=1 Tax=Elysia crispata TaxID=231223 RepID=A0AAE0Z665_9GAST|nr:hypothetical protein RRG08_053039 [Elysia crispata]
MSLECHFHPQFYRNISITERLTESPGAEDDAGVASWDPLADGKTPQPDLDAIVEAVPEAQEVGAELQITRKRLALVHDSVGLSPDSA